MSNCLTDDAMTTVQESFANLAGIVLAAGGSTRLGQAKQLLVWQGDMLVKHAARRAARICGAGVVVVTGAHAEEVEAAVADSAHAVRNLDWKTGMGSSLACGASAVEADAVQGILVLLCDQPLIAAADLVSLVRLWQNSAQLPAACGYGDRIGVPAVFPSSWLPRLKALTGDRGAQALFADSGAQVLHIAGAEHDIDTQEDWYALQQVEDKG